VNHWSIALHKHTKDQRSPEHADVIVGVGHAKKESTKS
jgi:hypothetical protein